MLRFKACLVLFFGFWFILLDKKENCLYLVSTVFTNGLGDRGLLLGQVIPKTQKWYLMSPCLTLHLVRYGSRVKWSNLGNGVVPSLWVALNYSWQLYLLWTCFYLWSVFIRMQRILLPKCNLFQNVCIFNYQN